jgi:hypothetical protein
MFLTRFNISSFRLPVHIQKSLKEELEISSAITVTLTLTALLIFSTLTSVIPSAMSQPILINSQVDLFEHGQKEAALASRLRRSARSENDWKLVIQHWKKAVALMKKVPTSHPKAYLVNDMIEMYGCKLSEAQSYLASFQDRNWLIVAESCLEKPPVPVPPLPQVPIPVPHRLL